MLTAADVRKSFKYLFPDELPALQSLVAPLPPHPIVINVGAGAGTSGLAILETRPDVILLTIDITDASSPYGCLEAERDVVQRAGMGDRWGVTWFQAHMDSKKAANYLIMEPGLDGARPSPFDLSGYANLIFIDGDHSYEGCLEDLRLYTQLIDTGGIIAVHDYLKGNIPVDPDGPHPKPWPGVDQAVDYFLIDNSFYTKILHVDSLIAFRKEQTNG